MSIMNMTGIKKLHFPKIYLFDDEAQKGAYFNNDLKEFIYYLKYNGKKGVIDFTYSCEQDSLHRHLTLKDNLILDAIPTRIIGDKENNLNEFIDTLQNPYLIQMIHKLGDLNSKIPELDHSTTRLASIVKAILSESEYVFLVRPEKYQNKEILSLIRNCIEFEVENNSKVFLIKPSNKDFWLDLATHIITKEKNHDYTNTPNPLKKSKRVQEFKPTYDFSLGKKAS